MARTRAQEVRRSQKKSFYIEQLSEFILRIAYDEPIVAQVFLTRVELSSDGGICYLYFSAYGADTQEGRESVFKEACDRLILYKPSLRKALAQAMHSRYVPNLRFLFDEQREKEMRVNELLLQVGEELAELDAEDKEEHTPAVEDAAEE
ncbi:MAG: ribosome-binding factor A [Candidatus Dependentiae bacterium]|jgi:ribosome-binding factor A